jgi:hypothetical protein
MNLREKIESALKGNEYVFDPQEMPTMSIREMAEKGLYPVCYRCGTRLEFALSPSEAKEKGIPPGVSCPKSLSHCQIAVDFANKDVDQMNPRTNQ